MENGQRDVSTDDHGTSTWGVITCGANRYIGRVAALDHVKVEKKAGKPAVTNISTEVTDADVVLAARVVTLKPCYDFFAPLRQVQVTDNQGKPVMVAPGVPQMGVARDPLVMTHDFALHPHPVHIILGGGTVIEFFQDMHEDDRKTYVTFVDAAEGATRVHRAGKAGLTLVGGKDVDAVTRPRSR